MWCSLVQGIVMARQFDELMETSGSPILSEAFDGELSYTAPDGTVTTGDGRVWDEEAQTEGDDEGQIVIEHARCTLTNFAVVPLRAGTITQDGVVWSIVSVDSPTGNRYRLVLRREERFERSTRDYRTARRGSARGS